MFTASGSLRLHLKSHLHRLAADALTTMSSCMGGAGGGGGGGGQQLPPTNASLLQQMLPQDPLMVRDSDLTIVKQEIFDSSETSDVRP